LAIVNDPPDHRPDPLFEHVEEWRAEFDEDWFDRFGHCVMIGMISAVIVLALVVTLR
jgi:hypothetical protein